MDRSSTAAPAAQATESTLLGLLLLMLVCAGCALAAAERPSPAAAADIDHTVAAVFPVLAALVEQ